MLLTTLLNCLLDGLLMGTIYGLAAFGLNLIYGVMRVVNIAHGDFLMLGAYLGYWMFVLFGIDPILSAILLIPPSFILGLFIFRFMVDPLLKRAQVSKEDTTATTAFLTFGMSVFIEALALVLWTPTTKTILTSYSGTPLQIFGLFFSTGRVLASVAALFGVCIIYVLLKRTDFGRALRGVIQNREAATLVGVNIGHTLMIAYGIGTVLAVVAGPLIALVFPINPYMGINNLTLLFCVVIVGGLGNPLGAIIGGITIGVAESLVSELLAIAYAPIVSYVLLILILLVFPEGVLRGER